MDPVLSASQVRVLGCLIEKELTTPEYYPLTLNALVAACNQKSNRAPVVSMSESDVSTTLETLRARHLAWEHHGAGSRVAKYSHNLKAIAELLPQQVAVLCELLIRGAQTPGELRTRASRMFGFRTTQEIEEALKALAETPSGALVAELPRVAGHRENRWAHLLCGEPAALPPAQSSEGDTTPVISRPAGTSLSDLERRVAELEERLARLESQLGGTDTVGDR